MILFCDRLDCEHNFKEYERCTMTIIQIGKDGKCSNFVKKEEENKKEK